MSMKLAAAVSAAALGLPLNVSALCREQKLSRKTFYKWVDRYRREGLDGLQDRSRRPHASPNRTPADTEDEIVRLRKHLHDSGADHGATTIQWHLGRDCRFQGRVPSVSSVHRVLVRRGLVDPQPEKRPKSSWRRFEAASANERWQIDAMDWVIATGVVRVINVIDDHSRVVVASYATPEATSEAAWTAFSHAAARWGAPVGVLSDNGLAFSGKLRRVEVLFEARLRDAGVRPSTGRPFHPQTTGKVERFQQTLKKWLRRRPLAVDLAALQAELDEFSAFYNEHRPHQGIGRCTPLERWNASTKLTPTDGPLPHPDYHPRVHNAEVNTNGRVCAGRYLIQIGSHYAGHHARIVIDTTHATVTIDDQLVRHLKLDPTRRYQPSGQPRGRRRQLPS